MGGAPNAQPTGTVTFLFTDLVDHTRLWEQHPAEMARSLERHDEIVRTAVEAHGGYVFSTAGDAFSAAFSAVDGAAEAAIEIQQRLAAESWPEGCELRSRLGLHTGEAQERDGDYFGPVVIRAARLMALGHGGQILVSGVSASLLQEQPGHREMLSPLGEVFLRGLGRAEHVHELRYPGAPEELPAIVEASPPIGNLPSVADELVGRNEDVAEVLALLSRGSLCTLTGPGGVGKTRLAMEAGSRATERFADGVWFVPLAQVTDPNDVPTAVADVLGVQEAAGRTLTDSIVGAIGGRDLLLILDNCEHVLEGAQRLTEAVVRNAAPVVVLATSREPLAAGGERVVPVEPLATEVDEAETAPAVALFGRRAEAADPAFALDASTIDTVRTVCAQLDGMPLAIELAAARVRGLGLSGLAEHLDDRFRLLHRRGGSDLRHQTLRATVGWSYDLLDARLQLLFARASVFAGGFDLGAAEAVLADHELDELDVADGLGELVDKSMLQTREGSTGRRFRMLETMRQFGESVADPAELDRTRGRFVGHYARWCEDAAREMEGPGSRDAVRRVRADFDNVREAVRLAIEHDRLDDAVAIALGMDEYGLREITQEPALWSLDLVGRLDPTSERYDELLGEAIWGCRRRGDLAEVRRLTDIFDELDSSTPSRASARTLHLLGQTYWFLRQTERSVELHQRSLAAARAVGNRAMECRVLSTLSMAEDSFDRERAEATARTCLALAERVRCPRYVCGGLLSLAGVMAHRRPEEAADVAGELTELAHVEELPWYEATGTRIRAHALSRSGELSEASSTFIRALDLNGVGDHGELLWYTVLNVVEHLIRIGRPRAAAIAYGALTSAPARPSDELIARALERMRDRIEADLDRDPSELLAAGKDLRLAELLRHLHRELADHAAGSSPLSSDRSTVA